jgi:hypothetical protein
VAPTRPRSRSKAVIHVVTGASLRVITDIASLRVISVITDIASLRVISVITDIASLRVTCQALLNG